MGKLLITCFPATGQISQDADVPKHFQTLLLTTKSREALEQRYGVERGWGVSVCVMCRWPR